MGRLIDAEKLKAHYAWWKDGTREMTMAEAKDIIDEIVDLQPTVEKHGHWYIYYNENKPVVAVCDQCGQVLYYTNRFEGTPNYCGNCGAKMDGGKDDADE